MNKYSSPYKELKLNARQVVGTKKLKNPKGVVYPHPGKRKVTSGGY